MIWPFRPNFGHCRLKPLPIEIKARPLVQLTTELTKSLWRRDETPSPRKPSPDAFALKPFLHVLDDREPSDIFKGKKKQNVCSNAMALTSWLIKVQQRPNSSTLV